MHIHILRFRKESDKKIMAVLNDDQKQKYSEIEKQMREQAKQRRQETATAELAGIAMNCLT
jgi:hypothetical protein